MHPHRNVYRCSNSDAVNREEENLHPYVGPKDRLITERLVKPVLDEVIGYGISNYEDIYYPDPQGKGPPQYTRLGDEREKTGNFAGADSDACADSSIEVRAVDTRMTVFGP